MGSVQDYARVNSADKLKSGKSIFIWLDIFGIADAVNDAERYEELSELLTKFQSLLNKDDTHNTAIIIWSQYGFAKSSNTRHLDVK